MSQKYGDLPAIRGPQGAAKNCGRFNDSQHDIYVQILKWLTMRTPVGGHGGCPGSVTPCRLTETFIWATILANAQKVVNTIYPPCAGQSQQKSGDARECSTTKVCRHCNTPAKYPLMAGLGRQSPVHFKLNSTIIKKIPGIFGFNISRENVSKTFLDHYYFAHDPRTFVHIDPAPAQ